ncbi:MAG: diguanylate cyclase [Pseudomonadota bacterium]
MRAFLSRWLCRLVGLLVMQAAASAAFASEFRLDSLDTITELHGVWRFRPGDDPRWASPDYDHSDWDNILVPRDWRRQGHEDLVGLAWYRAEVQLDRADVENLNELSWALGSVHNAYEAYAGGILLGGAGRLPPDPEMVSDRLRIFSIPPGAVAEDGRLILAVRVWRSETLGKSSTAGMAENEYMLGKGDELTQRVWLKESMSLMLAITYFGFGLYHLYLYSRNRRLPEYLWFGLTASLVAVYSTEISQWIFIAPWLKSWPYLVHEKIEYSVIYVLPGIGLQLLACLLQFKPPLWLRAYQLGFAATSLLVLLIPGREVLTYSLFYWQCYLIPGLIGTLVAVVWFAARGHLEARTMTMGWAIFLFCALNDIMVAQGVVTNPRISMIGFFAVLVSMAVSLANRFTRLYNHLDGEVQRRTRELQESNERLVKAARMDMLTGLLNRRGFAEVVSTEIERSGRSGRSFVVMMADIDRFKSVNDEYGHAAGDYALRQTAKLLSGQLRDIDTLARWGGEEFIFLLPETTLQGGAILAEKLRRVLERTHFTFEGNVLSITITIGVSAYLEGMSFEDCVNRADSVLYSGKQSGRNKVLVDDQSNANGEAHGASAYEAPGSA